MLLFSQKSTLDVAAAQRQAERHFGARLDVVELAAGGSEACLRVVAPHAEFHGAFRVVTRPKAELDELGLDLAEAQNHSHGMADLARRCGSVWEISRLEDTSEAAGFYLAAILAGVALGPALPAGGAGLYGVRSCRERAEALAGNPSGLSR